MLSIRHEKHPSKSEATGHISDFKSQTKRKKLPPKWKLYGSGRRIRTVLRTVRANRMSPLARRLRGNRSGMTYVRVRIHPQWEKKKLRPKSELFCFLRMQPS